MTTGATPTSETVAYADESAATDDDGRRVYVLAATIVSLDGDSDGGDSDDLRAQMRLLLGTRARQTRRSGLKLHWYDENDARRSLITETVIGITAVTHLAVCVDTAHRKDERARMLCFERLLDVLAELDVTRLILERRDPRLDSRDINIAVALRRQGIATNLRLSHADPGFEELLWIPDAVAGAFTTAHTGQPKFWDALRATERVHAHLVAFR